MRIVITGASSGLGEVMARKFVEDGHNVAGIARRTPVLNGIAEEYGGKFRGYTADITKKEDVKSAFDRIIYNHPRINVLINNAAVFSSCPFHEEKLENIDKLIDLNLKSAMYCTHAALKAMMDFRVGHIINIASVSGTHGIPSQAIYGASKHGLIGFGDVIGQELKEHGINVTTICPGGIDTPLWNEDNPYPGEKEKLIDPKEIADLIGFILEKPTLYKKVIMFPQSEWH